jgi:hypothetical protein
MTDMSYSDLRRIVGKNSNKEECIKLLEASTDKESFLNFIYKYIDKNTLLGEVDISKFDEPLSENEYRSIPYFHQQSLFILFESQSITPISASDPEFWLSVTLQAIKNNIISPSFLAFPEVEGSANSGKLEIEKALKSETSTIKKMFRKRGNNPLWLTVSRKILKSAFGHIEVRGKKGIYQDIPFATAWWVSYISNEVSKSTTLEAKEISLYLINNKTLRNEIFMRMSGSLTILADNNIRDAIFLYLLPLEGESKMTATKFTSANSKNPGFAKRIGIESSWRCMGALESIDNVKILEQIAQ